MEIAARPATVSEIAEVSRTADHGLKATVAPVLPAASAIVRPARQAPAVLVIVDHVRKAASAIAARVRMEIVGHARAVDSVIAHRAHQALRADSAIAGHALPVASATGAPVPPVPAGQAPHASALVAFPRPLPNL